MNCYSFLLVSSQLESLRHGLSCISALLSGLLDELHSILLVSALTWPSMYLCNVVDKIDVETASQ